MSSASRTRAGRPVGAAAGLGGSVSRGAHRRRGESARSGPRVRWERLGRVAMLCVLCALLYLYLSAGIHMFSTWRQSSHDHAAVTSMEREHAQLVGQHETLRRQTTLEGEARQLGMMKKGEQPYIMGGLPGN
jgi:hypothetical protein